MWADLIEIATKNGKDKLHIVNFIALHTDYHVNEFAHLLLRDHAEVKELRKQSRDKNEFVCAVFKTWISTTRGPAVPCMWESLVKCMRSADLDGPMVQTIRSNVC